MLDDSLRSARVDPHRAGWGRAMPASEQGAGSGNELSVMGCVPTPSEMAASKCFGYSRKMVPLVVRDGPFRLFFFSREELRVHVHVAHPDGEAKFWLTPTVQVATSTGLTPRQLAAAQAVVTKHI